MDDRRNTQVARDLYKDVMQSLETPSETTLMVETQVCAVPDSFRDRIICAIRRLNRRKAQGPDLISPEIFHIQPERFANAEIPVWRSVGRIAQMPPLLPSSVRVRIYKRKGDAALPKNHRPVSNTSDNRRLIATA